MSWKDELRPASFRGVEFFIESSQRGLGRRAVLHEFPDRDTPYTEDNGRIADTFEIEGHVLGDDYFEAKRKLEKVFNKKGPGELIHPYYGTKIVQVGPVNFTESNREGGILVFTASFMEAGDNRFPRSKDDKAANLLGAANNAKDLSKKDFDDKFSVAGLPSFAVDSARSGVALAQETFDKVTKTFADIADGTAKLAYTTRSLTAEVNDLLQAPSKLSQRLLDSFELMQDAFSNALGQFNSTKPFYQFGKDLAKVITGTPIRDREDKNQTLLNNFMRRSSALDGAIKMIELDFTSIDDALTTRDEVIDILDEQIAEDIDTDLYQALIDTKAALSAAVPDRDTDLPNIVEYENLSTNTSLNLTYDLFESPENEQDIIDRNDVRHPGFVPAGTLEILNA